jgi:murein DD-endopeptidase MepM/ murein hydrolase activator NlpD
MISLFTSVSTGRRTKLLIWLIFGFLLLSTAGELYGQTILPLSKGWYRMPYGEDWEGSGGEQFAGVEEGTFNLFSNNHNGYDLIGLPKQAWDSATPHKIVAMADGIIRDAFDDCNECSDSNCNTDASGLCPCNNYIWIEHPNGEWSAYLHIAANSLQVGIGDCVVAGQHIANEGDVGSTSNGAGECDEPEDLNREKKGCNGLQPSSNFLFPCCAVHLHFAVYSASLFVVSVPDDFQVIPRICGIEDHVIKGNQRVVPSGDVRNCLTHPCPAINVSIDSPVSVVNDQKVVAASNTITTNGVILIANAVVGYEAGNQVTLNPGFMVLPGSYFRASIDHCYSTANGCPSP